MRLGAGFSERNARASSRRRRCRRVVARTVKDPIPFPAMVVPVAGEDHTVLEGRIAAFILARTFCDSKRRTWLGTRR